MADSNPYHYTNCGLPNVWLENGYDVEKNSYGDFVSIKDVEGLHDAIADALVKKSSPLTGAEFRFLRKKLDMSQKRLGELFSRDRQSIASWEKDDEVVEPFDWLIRHIYQENTDKNAAYVDLVDYLNELDRQDYDGLQFASDRGAWKKAG